MKQSNYQGTTEEMNKAAKVSAAAYSGNTTPGHTKGHRSLMVKLPKSGTLLITGDLYHTRQNYEKSLVPRINDRADTQASMDRFARIAANTKARVIIQHAPEDFASMPAFPKYLD